MNGAAALLPGSNSSVSLRALILSGGSSGSIEENPSGFLDVLKCIEAPPPCFSSNPRSDHPDPGPRGVFRPTNQFPVSAPRLWRAPFSPPRNCRRSSPRWKRRGPGQFLGGCGWERSSSLRNDTAPILAQCEGQFALLWRSPDGVSPCSEVSPFSRKSGKEWAPSRKKQAFCWGTDRHLSIIMGEDLFWAEECEKTDQCRCRLPRRVSFDPCPPKSGLDVGGTGLGILD